MNIRLTCVGLLTAGMALAGYDPLYTELKVIPRPKEIVEKEGFHTVRAKEVSPSLVARFETDGVIPHEGYRLAITPKEITVAHSDAAGRFYALETLKQLAERAGDTLSFPCCELNDRPAFRWRGLQLDDCRHFFGKETVKLTLDLMAMHKLNVFHWHLTDDQGWRIDVPGMPELVRFGAVRPRSPRHGVYITDRNADDPSVYTEERYGPFYYSRADLEEIVAYAKARHILVVPEIDVPGHLRAALAAHPEYSCVGETLSPRTPWCRWGVSKDVLCVGNDEALRFVERVLDYVCEVFDAPYIHIGGDECPSDRWGACPKCRARMKTLGLKRARDLQGYVTKRMADHLATKGRRIIGWGEMLDADAPASAVVMSWRGNRAELEAVDRGNEAILAAGAYLDTSQGLMEDAHQYFGGDISLENVFAMDPLKGVPEDRRDKILGGQCCNWSEYTWNIDDLMWKMWPRACALAEAMWTRPENAFNGRYHFLRRVAVQRQCLLKMGVNCAPVR